MRAIRSPLDQEVDILEHQAVAAGVSERDVDQFDLGRMRQFPRDGRSLDRPLHGPGGPFRRSQEFRAGVARGASISRNS